MLGFGGDCFLGRKLNGKMIEGRFQSKLICVLEQLCESLYRKVHFIFSSSSAGGYIFQKPKPTYRFYLHI